MAYAKLETITTTRTVTVEEDVVHLTISRDEATTLAAIMAAVGGTPERSRRAHTDSIGDALRVLGFHWEDIRRTVPGCSRDKMHGSISFNLHEYDDVSN